MSISTNKVIVILGASSGIGAYLAEYFARNGAFVHLIARRENLLNALTERLNASGFSASYSVSDALDYNSIKKISDNIFENFGRIDLWINCVGQNEMIGKSWELDPDDTYKEIEANLISQINGTHAVLQNMLANNEGRIVCLCGGGATSPNVYSAGYSAAKTGVARFVETVVQELNYDDSKIKIFAINPPFTRNERTIALSKTEKGKKYYSWLPVYLKENRNLETIYLAEMLEHILTGELDVYSGRLIYCVKNIKMLVDSGKRINNTMFGYLRPEV